MKTILSTIFLVCFLTSCNKSEINPYTSEYDLLGTWSSYNNDENFIEMKSEDYIRYSFIWIRNNIYYSMGRYTYCGDTIKFKFERYQNFDTTMTINYVVNYDRNKLILRNDSDTIILIKQ